MMNVDHRDIEDIEDIEDYEMVPLESMMQGFGEMNSRPVAGMYSNMGINMGMDMDPYMGMDPSMAMANGYNQDPSMEMYPSIEMNKFNNEGVFMNGSNPMGLPYENVDMSAYEDDGLREQDMYEDRKPYNDGYNKFNPKYNDVDYIVNRIERYNPEIFKMLTRCGIHYRGAVGLVKRIVRLTLMYRDE
ncbi:MAG: hypothetical protein ACJAX4_002825 [Clostridium sp.]|jgi:hypothetical protein